MGELEAVMLHIRGRVQGVGFRVAARAAAGRCAVGGWVRNRNDGSVEIAAEGTPGALAAFAEWCRHGPPEAVVASVDATPVEPRGATSFEIR